MSQSSHSNQQELLHGSKAQHGPLPKHAGQYGPHTKELNGFVMFVWGWGEGGFPPAFKKKKKPKKKQNPPKTPKNKKGKKPQQKNHQTPQVLGPKILQIESLNLVGCFVKFCFPRRVPHTVLTSS